MNNYGKHRRNGIDNLQVALKKIMRDRKEKVAFMTANERFCYGDITKQIKAQYDEYRSHNVSKIALCMSNSVEFCIQLLTAVLYLDEVYIFSPLWEETVVNQICQDNKIQVLVCEKNRKVFLENKSTTKSEDDTKIILFTSGTMHTPKGVVLTGESLYANALAAIDCMEYVDTDMILVTKPLYHSYGLTIELMAGMLVGAGFYLDMGLFTVNKVSRILKEYGITVWCTVPTMLCLFIDKKVPICNSLRIIAVGGARADERLLKRAKALWSPTPIIQLYGLTEAGPLVTGTPVDLPIEKIASIGKPVKGVKLEIRDREDNVIRTPYTMGELVVVSRSIMKEYLFDKVTSQKVKRDGRLYTGDIGYFDKDSFYYVRDRIDTMIVRDGVNILCSEIEDILMELDVIDQVSVVGMEDMLHSQIAVAFIKAAGDLDRKEIITWCKVKEVPPPDEIIFVGSLPYNDNGKVNIDVLKKMYFAEGV